MKNYIIILSIILLSSCATQKRCAEKFPPHVFTLRYDSIIYRDSVVFKDRIVEIKIPADTVYQERVINVPVDLYVYPIAAENDYARAVAWVEHSKIKLELTQKERTIREIIEKAEKETYYWKEKYHNEKIVEVVKEKVKPKMYKFVMWYFFSSIVIIAGYLAIKLKFIKLF